MRGVSCSEILGAASYVMYVQGLKIGLNPGTWVIYYYYLMPSSLAATLWCRAAGFLSLFGKLGGEGSRKT